MQRTLEFLAVCGVLFLALGASARAAGTTGEVPDGVSAADWSGIRQAYEAGRHAARPSGGGWQAHTPGQRLRTRFDGRGFTTRPDAGGWTWGLELLRYGFAGRERAWRARRA